MKVERGGSQGGGGGVGLGAGLARERRAAERVAQVVSPDGHEDQTRAGDPFLGRRLFHLSKKIPGLRSIYPEVVHGDDEAGLAEGRRHALGIAAAARRVARAARERIPESDDPVRTGGGHGRSGGGRRERDRPFAHALAEAAGESGGGARREDARRENAERGRKEPEEEAAGRERHGGVLCRKSRNWHGFAFLFLRLSSTSREDAMGRISGLVAGAVLLTGCYSTVLEIRTAPPGRLIASSRTLVVADMAEPYRSGVEDAIARQLPGAATAHARADGEVAVRRALLDGIEGPGLAAEWDAVVLATVGHLTSERHERDGGIGAGGIPAGTGLSVGGIPENPNTGSNSYASITCGRP